MSMVAGLVYIKVGDSGPRLIDDPDCEFMFCILIVLSLLMSHLTIAV